MLGHGGLYLLGSQEYRHTYYAVSSQEYMVA